MKLYVMRHGPAEESSATQRDGDRVLTESGRERIRSVAEELAAHDELPHTIITSPLARALQTAEIVAAQTKLGANQGGHARSASEPLELRRELAPGGDHDGLVRELARRDTKRVMVVGHEPDLSDLVHHLLGRELQGGLQKGMVVGFRLEPAKISRDYEASLRFVLDPKSLHWHWSK